MLNDHIDILVVEDDSDDLDLSLRALRKERICNTIEVARDGEEALDLLLCRGAHATRNPALCPRLILLDLKLPKVNGLEVLAEIKRHARTRSVPVVILTSSKQEEDIVRGYQLGANSYIQKPVDFEQFQATIRQLGYYWLLVNQPPPEIVFSGVQRDEIPAT